MFINNLKIWPTFICFRITPNEEIYNTRASEISIKNLFFKRSFLSNISNVSEFLCVLSIFENHHTESYVDLSEQAFKQDLLTELLKNCF